LPFLVGIIDEEKTTLTPQEEKLMQTCTKTIRFLFVILSLSLLTAACTPAATPPGDTGQEEQAPTLTLSATETIPPTQILTLTTTPIPPTPTFPAPESADLPDSAVRGVNEQGREVILDQPGGEPLWTLVEDEHGDLAWQKASDYEQDIAAALEEGIFAKAAEISQAAVEDEDSKLTAQEVFADLWLPVLQKQTPYSDPVWERAQSVVAEFGINEQGLVEILGEGEEILFKQSQEEESNLSWQASLRILVAQIDDEEFEEVLNRFTWPEEGLQRDNNNNLYYFFVAIDEVVPLNTDFELETGEKITDVTRCYYMDVKGNTQFIYMPFSAYDQHDLEFWFLGMGVTQRDSRSDFLDEVDLFKSWRVNGKGPMSLDGRPQQFPVGISQILLIGSATKAGGDLDVSTENFFAEAIPAEYEREEFEKFFSEGSPDAISFSIPGLDGPVLLPQTVVTRGNALFHLQLD
jgi:hypothetical protein